MATPIPPGSVELFGMIIDWWDLAKVAGGSLVTVLLFVLRLRRSRIVWHANHNGVAVSTNDAAFGNIVVTRNGAAVRNLFVAIVNARNDYSRDFENVVVRVVIRNEHTILSDAAQRIGTKKALEYSPQLQKEIDVFHNVVNPEDGSQPTPRTWREYRLPVWNRGEEVRIAMLIDAPPPTEPYCDFSIDAAGTKTVFRASNASYVWGIPIAHACAAGVVAVVPLAAAVGTWMPPLAQPPLYVLLGVFTISLGAGFMWLYHKARAAIL